MSDQGSVLDTSSISVDTNEGKFGTEKEPDSNFDKEKCSTETLTEDTDTRDNQDSAGTVKEQTIEPVNNFDNAEQSNSRELKLLLALSRESNLDTNISRKIKRKSSEHSKKDKDFHYSHGKSKHKHMNSSGKSPRKLLDGKPVRYPVTAESELESEVNTENAKTEVNSEISAKRKREGLTEDSNVGGASEEISKKLRKSLGNEVIMFKPGKDMFCWRCHRDGVNITCETCVRSYHQKCLKQTILDPEHWPCPECVSILKAESTQSRSEAMKGMTLEHLCGLLKFAVNRMIQCQGSEPFIHPVSDKEFPEYKKYIVQPMNLTLLEKNIKDNFYGSPQAFEADAKWILHNSIIFNSFQSKLTYAAKNIIRICKQEMAEIENCPSCYLNANTKKKTWFTEVCPKPHPIAWAKLKGFPYWPAKIMCYKDDLADVRFFGAHDRAWVPYRDCFLFSLEDPNGFKLKRQDIEQCIDELKIYVGNLKKIYGKFRYAPYKTTLDPYNETKQLQIFLPTFGKITIEVKDAHKKNNNETCVDSNDINKNEKKTHGNGETKDNGNLANDNESMEGYGTDDEGMINIDTEKRKKLLGITEKDCDEEMECEDEDDTQVLSVTASLLKKKAKLRDELNSDEVGGKVKVIQKSTGSGLKQSSEEKLNSLEIGERRNSETSVKSDSSCVSNISDKINKVTISENMEISLRNDYTGCSISENISSNNSESSRSDSDISVELKRKPVQIDIDNTEYTISPSNKIKISDKLMKRLSDEGESSSNDTEKDPKKVVADENEEKAVEQGSKSQTDLLIEKFKEVVQHKVVDFSNPPEGTENQDNQLSISKKSTQDLNLFSDKQPEDKVCEDMENLPSSTSNEIRDNSESDNNKNEAFINRENKTNVSPLKTPSCSDKNGTEINSVSSEADKNQNDELNTEKDLAASTLGNKVAINSLECKTKSVNDDEMNTLDRRIENDSTKVMSKNINNDSEGIITEKDNVILKSTHNQTDQTKEKTINDKSAQLNQTSETSVNENEQISPENQKEGERSDSLNIIEEVVPDEDYRNDMLDETQIDQASIMSIIHSSLDVSNTASKTNKSEIIKTPEKKEASKNKVVETKKQKHGGSPSTKITEKKDESTLEEPRKRKALDEVECSPSKVFKLVPMVNVSHVDCEKLKSKPNEKGSEPVDTTIKHKENDTLKKVSNVKSTTSETSPASSVSIEGASPVDIKSEPDSEVEQENLEAKKKYLSALQIAEKKNIPEAASSRNHIRTRARAEEKRERFKNTNSISNIIDDMAVNFGITPESRELSARTSEKAKTYASVNKKEGEIFVKSFAKMVPKQRARKSFPMPNYSKPKSILHHKEGVSSVKSTGKFSSVSRPQISSTTNTITQSPSVSTPSKPAPTVKSLPQNTIIAQPLEAVKTGNGYLVLQSPQTNEFVLVPNQSISFTPQVTNQGPTVTKATGSPASNTSVSAKPTQSKRTVEINCSQNYIPQNEENNDMSLRNSNHVDQPTAKPSMQQSASASTQPSASTSQTPPVVGDLSQSQLQPTPQSQESDQGTSETQTDEDFSILNSMLPENVSKTISTMLRRPPPKLKPRPPGMLSANFAEGNPSSVGDVSSRINSVAHRLSDYFRGMLIETLEDFGKSSNPEATIIQLKLEIESLKHKHNVELAEIEKNMSTVLRDIQRSIIEDRDKIVDETRAQCELEAIKRIEEAKSKQWCANCSKESQFYCCWNTSYCDYPCQQKHWPQHMSKCTQNLNHTPVPTSVHCPTGQSIILRPAHPPPKPAVGRLVTKPVHKVYMNRNISNILPKTVKMQSPNHMTVVETSLGNFQVVSAPVTFRSSNLNTVKSTTTQPFPPDKPSTPRQKIIAPLMPVATILDDSD